MFFILVLRSDFDLSRSLVSRILLRESTPLSVSSAPLRGEEREREREREGGRENKLFPRTLEATSCNDQSRRAFKGHLGLVLSRGDGARGRCGCVCAGHGDEEDAGREREGRKGGGSFLGFSFLKFKEKVFRRRRKVKNVLCSSRKKNASSSFFLLSPP